MAYSKPNLDTTTNFNRGTLPGNTFGGITPGNPAPGRPPDLPQGGHPPESEPIGIPGGQGGPIGGTIQPITAFFERWIKEARSHRVLGLQTGAYLRVQDTDMKGHTETAGYTKNIDIASMSTGAIISIVNGTGSSRTFKDVGMVGKVVLQVQGDDGYTHDAWVDYEDIEKNGDRTVTWGNDFVVTLDQTNKIADYLHKYFKGDKHRYAITLTGQRYYYHAGDWVQIQIGAAGTIENVDSLARIASVEVSHSKSMGGQTTLVIEEILENWKHDSNAGARYFASGKTHNKNLGQGAKILVAALGYIGPADIWCDGTADDVQIQAGLDYLEAIGGGVCILTEGTFNTTAAISMKSRAKLVGSDRKATFIKRNANDYTIEADGANGAELEGVEIHDLTCQRTDSNTKASIWCEFSDDMVISNVTVEECDTGIELVSCDVVQCADIKIINPAAEGFLSLTSDDVQISNLVIDGEQTREALLTNGFIMSGDRVTVSNVIVKNLYSSADTLTCVELSSIGMIIGVLSINGCDNDQVGNTCTGLIMGANNITISTLVIDDVDNSGAAADSIGLSVTGDGCTVASIEAINCSGTGIVIEASADKTQILSGRVTGNATAQITDSGTDSTYIVEDA